MMHNNFMKLMCSLKWERGITLGMEKSIICIDFFPSNLNAWNEERLRLDMAE